MYAGGACFVYISPLDKIIEIVSLLYVPLFCACSSPRLYRAFSSLCPALFLPAGTPVWSFYFDLIFTLNTSIFFKPLFLLCLIFSGSCSLYQGNYVASVALTECSFIISKLVDLMIFHWKDTLLRN